MIGTMHTLRWELESAIRTSKASPLGTAKFVENRMIDASTGAAIWPRRLADLSFLFNFEVH